MSHETPKADNEPSAPDAKTLWDGFKAVAGILSFFAGVFVFANTVTNAIGPPPIARAEAPLFDKALWSAFIVSWGAVMGALGGLLWRIRARIKGLRVYGGSVEGEPHGRFAFEWGAISFIAVALGFVPFGTWFLDLDLLPSVLIAAIFLAGAALGGRLFFGGCERPGHRGVRQWVEMTVTPYVQMELMVSVLWGIVVGGTALAGAALARYVFVSPHTLNAPNAILALAMPVVLSAASVFVSVATDFHGPMADAMRGPLAAVALRTGAFLGLILISLPA